MNLVQRWKLVTNPGQPRRHLSCIRQASFFANRSVPQFTFYSKATVENARREEGPCGRDLPPISLASIEDFGGSSFLPSSFSCQKCRLRFAVEPVITFCGHVFCWPCLYQSISRGVGLLRGNCPTCQSAVDLFRPVKTVIPIKNVHNEAPRRRPGWVPSPPKASCYMQPWSPSYSWTETAVALSILEHVLLGDLFKATKAKMDSISLEIEGRLENLSSQLVNAQGEQDDEHSPSELRNPPKKLENSITTETTSSLLAAEEMHVEDVAILWLDNVYTVFQEHALTAIDNVNELRQIMKKLCSELDHSHFPPCVPFRHAKYTPINHELVLQLRVRDTKMRCYSRSLPSQEVPIQSFSKPSQEIPFQPFLLSSQEDLIQSFATNSKSSNYMKSVLTIPRKKGPEASAGYHSLATQEESGFDEPMTLHTGKKFSYCKKKMSQVFLEIEKLLDDLFSTMHENNEKLLMEFKLAETYLKSILLGLLDGWCWVEWGLREENMQDTQEVNKQLSKLSEDWVEVVGRDFTNALGPVYLRLRTDASPSVAVDSHLSLPTPMPTFCCNICGKVNDAIKEPIVTQCGHLFCWDCLCSHGRLTELELFCYCPVCDSIAASGILNTTSATMIPVSGNTISADDNKSPPWPALRRFKIPTLNENIKLFCMTATEIEKICLIRQEETEMSKRAFDALKQNIKLVSEPLKQLLSISNSNRKCALLQKSDFRNS